MKLSRRLVLALPLALASAPARAASSRMTVYKSAACTCCEGWVRHMQRAGFATEVRTVDDVSAIWRRHRVPDALSSCHVAIVSGYVVIGHVPAVDIRRLLAERPRAIGVSVPGMPVGSPGMEIPGVPPEAFQILLIMPDGRTRVFAPHSA